MQGRSYKEAGKNNKGGPLRNLRYFLLKWLFLTRQILIPDLTLMCMWNELLLDWIYSDWAKVCISCGHGVSFFPYTLKNASSWKEYKSFKQKDIKQKGRLKDIKQKGRLTKSKTELISADKTLSVPFPYMTVTVSIVLR